MEGGGGHQDCADRVTAKQKEEDQGIRSGPELPSATTNTQRHAPTTPATRAETHSAVTHMSTHTHSAGTHCTGRTVRVRSVRAHAPPASLMHTDK